MQIPVKCIGIVLRNSDHFKLRKMYMPTRELLFTFPYTQNFYDKPLKLPTIPAYIVINILSSLLTNSNPKTRVRVSHSLPTRDQHVISKQLRTPDFTISHEGQRQFIRASIKLWFQVQCLFKRRHYNNIQIISMSDKREIIRLITWNMEGSLVPRFHSLVLTLLMHCQIELLLSH